MDNFTRQARNQQSAGDEPGEKFLLCLIDRGSARFAVVHTPRRLLIVRAAPTTLASSVEFSRHVEAAAGVALSPPPESWWPAVVDRAERGELTRFLQRVAPGTRESSGNAGQVRVHERLAAHSMGAA